MSTFFIYMSSVLMAFALISVWFPGRCYNLPYWLWLLAGVVLVALPAQLLAPIAVVWIILALALIYAAQLKPALKRWLMIPLAFYLFALGLELLPGFARFTLIDLALLGDGVVPYGLRVGLAKPIAGLLVFAVFAPRCNSLREILIIFKSWPSWLFPALLVLAIAWILGVGVDFKWLWWTPLFILFNALFTVLPEEVFFRTFLQQPLHARFGNAWWIIPLIGILFAVVHVPPTDLALWRFFAVIFVAGMAYAWSFRQLRRVEAAMLTHLSANALHFVFLTYPIAFS